MLVGPSARRGQGIGTEIMRQVLALAFEQVSLHRVDLRVFDFNVAATKYFYGLEGGEVPLTLLFSGTVFYRDEDGFLQMDQIPWSRETACRLPVAVWRQMMDVYYPGSVWLRVERAAFDVVERLRLDVAHQEPGHAEDAEVTVHRRIRRGPGWAP